MSDQIKVEGRVIEAHPGGTFSVAVKFGPEEKMVLAHLSGKMRKNSIRVVTGDTVNVELSPYDLTKGRITFRPR